METKMWLMTLCGKLSTAVTDVNDNKAEQMLKKARRSSLREFSGSLNVSVENFTTLSQYNQA
jgi:hypothetical protein